MGKSPDSVVAEIAETWVRESVSDCAERLRRCEREFDADHAFLYAAHEKLSAGKLQMQWL